jgi:exonuclease III
MRIATWNVRTLYRAGAMREMVKEMDKYKIDICALQEIRWKGQKTELTGKGPLTRRRSTLDCSATEEEEAAMLTICTTKMLYIFYCF